MALTVDVQHPASSGAHAVDCRLHLGHEIFIDLTRVCVYLCDVREVYIVEQLRTPVISIR